MRCFKNIFILLLCSATSFCFAQKEDRNWVFGDSIRIDFNNLSNPTYHQADCFNNESNASISNRNGNLLMYLKTQDYWAGEYKYCQIMNKQNNVMQNGDSISHYYSASNGALFLPMPDDSNKYYFFSVANNLAQGNFLSYSIIDKSLNSGLGAVVSKNNYLENLILESICAIRHADGRDWWIITHQRYSNLFMKYLITPSGISSPLNQMIGTNFSAYEGECAASSDGSKICWISTDGNLDLFDFDRCSGELNNWTELGAPPYQSSTHPIYGCEFSPDSKRLYVSKTFGSPYLTNIFQYSINSNPISDSKTDILAPTQGFLLFQMELGPDNKIYISGSGPTGGLNDSSFKFLSVIETPNDSGPACNLNLFSLFLHNTYTMLGLPNMPHYSLSALDGSACDTLGIDAPNNIQVIRKSILNIYPNPATNELTIEILNGIAPKQIEITNSLGVTVMQLHQTKPTAQLNIRQLPAGVYFVKVKMQDGSVTVKRFIKL